MVLLLCIQALSLGGMKLIGKTFLFAWSSPIRTNEIFDN